MPFANIVVIFHVQLINIILTNNLQILGYNQYLIITKGQET